MKNKILIIIILAIFGNISFAQVTLDPRINGCTNNSMQFQEAFSSRCHVPGELYLKPLKDNYNDLHYVSLAKLNEEERIRRKELIINEPVDSLLHIVATEKGINQCNTIQKLGHIKDNKQIATLDSLLINGTKVYEKCYSAEALKFLNAKESIPGLILALSDPNYNVVLNAALALAELGEKEQSYIALKKLWEANLGVKSKCHTGFRDIGDQKSIDFLIAATNDTIAESSIDACIVLAQLGYGDLIKDKIISFSDSKEHHVRLVSLYVIYHYYTLEAVVSLASKLANDSDKYVYYFANQILMKYDK